VSPPLAACDPARLTPDATAQVGPKDVGKKTCVLALSTVPNDYTSVKKVHDVPLRGAALPPVQPTPPDPTRAQKDTAPHGRRRRR
jgi:hypothetical protein